MTSAPAYAVVDLETTGLSPTRHHRILELGVVHLDEQLQQIDSWSTLVNPARDVGPVEIHGVTSAMVRDAPTFADLAGDLHELLGGTVLVAHNAKFDIAFLEAEFHRACGHCPPLAAVCTMLLADSVGLPRSLAAACDAVGVEHRGAHTALGDATATTALFTALTRVVDLSPPTPPWDQCTNTIPPSGLTRSRTDEISVPGGDYLLDLLSRLPARSNEAIPGALHEAVISYRGVLDRALEDRVIDPDEATALAAVAEQWGLSPQVVIEIHKEYLRDLVAVALADGIISGPERRDLERVTHLLGGLPSDVDTVIAEVQARPRPTGPSHDLTGMSVCFTGDSECRRDGRVIERPVAEGLAVLHGLVPQRNVTKKLDVVVLSDPDSMSAKAEKARQYGTRIIAERQFWAMLGVAVD
jgi:DNA polymerase-3 subunit epsilon